jgi:hypothetical protein
LARRNRVDDANLIRVSGEPVTESRRRAAAPECNLNAISSRPEGKGAPECTSTENSNRIFRRAAEGHGNARLFIKDRLRHSSISAS